jgi:hypothetical protein
MYKEIPLLTPTDVELRVSQIQQNSYGTYVTLLCYKDARCDMNILDEVFGRTNWKRTHEVLNGNLFCILSIWDEEKQQWIPKEDVGTESNTEATKGQSSDSFKRASVNIGIGRELYDAPEIRFKLKEEEVYIGANNKPKTYAKFHIGTMTYDRALKQYTEFTVLDADGAVRYDMNRNRTGYNASSTPPPEAQRAAPPNHTAYPAPPNGSYCSECNSYIKSPKVAEYSLKNYGRVLCYNCQKKLDV